MASGADDFIRGLDRLDRAVGRGKLVGQVSFNQVYAQNQHESLHFKHPHGGRAKYLEGPLFEGAADFMHHLARRAITEQGSDLAAGMADNMETLARDSAKAAPKWFTDLSRSAHPTVTDRGVVSYDRAPLARRLSEEEIRLKNRWRIHPSRKGKKKGFR